MESLWKTIIWSQFGAAIDLLDEVVCACPDDLWHARLWHNPAEPPELSQYWYVVYHTLFWLDLYLTGAEAGFVPPPPFALIEQDDAGPIPARGYTKAELKGYLDLCRQRCQATMAEMTDETAQRRCRFGWGEVTFAELMLYTMRHVQGHAAQLGLMLGQHAIAAQSWIPRAK